MNLAGEDRVDQAREQVEAVDQTVAARARVAVGACLCMTCVCVFV